jgi:alpha-glucosidase
LSSGEGGWGGEAIDDEFLVGNSLLVAPILENGARSRDVTLPPGRWYSFWDDVLHTGHVRAEAPLERTPLFVRAGSILPTEADGTLTLHLYVPADDGEHIGKLYCDAGDGYGDSLLNHFSLWRAGRSLELRWEREGTFAFPYAHVEIRVHGADVARAVVDGAEADCRDSTVRLDGPCGKVMIELHKG